MTWSTRTSSTAAGWTRCGVGHPGAAEQLVAPDFVGHWPGRDVHGPAELAAIVAETRGMFAEIGFELQVGPIVEGDLVAARWTDTGSTADSTMNFLGNDIMRVADGRFVEYWTAFVVGLLSVRSPNGTRSPRGQLAHAYGRPAEVRQSGH